MTAKTKRAKPGTPKPRPNAFVMDTPCEHCGCEWGATTVNFDADSEEAAMGTACANPYCIVIQQLRASLVEVAKLAADTPQFDNPLHIMRAKRIRDAALAGKVRITTHHKQDKEEWAPLPARSGEPVEVK